jgi:hypothetical protein
VNRDHLSLIYQYALLLAAEEDWNQRELGKIHLLKYAYLADLAYAKYHGGETYTGVEWVFHHFGPWANRANDLIEAAAAGIGAEKITRPSDFEDEYVRFVIQGEPEAIRRQEEAVRHKLPLELRGVLRKAVHDYKADTKKLLHAVYATMPMLLAAPGDSLDFQSVIREAGAVYTVAAAPVPEISPSKKQQARLKARMAELRKQCGQNFARHQAEQARSGTEEHPAELVEVTAWLDQLAGGDFPSEDTTVHFAEEVWKSENRRGGTYDELPG